MENLLIIASTKDTDMLYAAGTAITDPFLLLDTGRVRHLLVTSLEYSRIRKELGGRKGCSVVLLDPYLTGKGLAEAAAAFLKKRKIRQVRMPFQSTALHVERLRKAGIKVSLTQAYPGRVSKSQAEVRKILEVRKATAAAMARCLSVIGQSTGSRALRWRGKMLTAEVLRLEVRKILLEHGCEAPSLIISHGSQTGLPHDEGSGILKKAEPIVLDLFPRSMRTGYWFDVTRTVCKGKAPERLRKLWDAVAAAQDAGLRTVRAGVKAASVHNAAAKELERHGFKTEKGWGFIHSLGHGVGLDIHESPSLSPMSTETLQEGNVITIEPGLYYPWGGVRLEDTVLVTKRGCRNLTKIRRWLAL